MFYCSLDEEKSEDASERVCDTLFMCIVTVLNHGLRNGGGIADILRKPSKDVRITSWHEALEQSGYSVVVARDFTEAFL